MSGHAALFPPSPVEPPRPGEPVVLGLGGRDTARRLAAGDAPPLGTRAPTSTEWAYLRHVLRRSALAGALGATLFLGMGAYFLVSGIRGIAAAAGAGAAVVMIAITLVGVGITGIVGVPLLFMGLQPWLMQHPRWGRKEPLRGVGRLRGPYLLRSKPVRPEVDGVPVNMLREWAAIVRDGTHTFDVWPSLEEVPDRRTVRTVLAVVDLGLSVDTEIRSGGLQVRDWPLPTAADRAEDAPGADATGPTRSGGA